MKYFLRLAPGGRYTPWLAALALLALLLAGRATRAQAPADGPLPVVAGTVNAIVRDGSTVYIGGTFSYVGPNTPNGSALDASAGTPNLAYARLNGVVNAAVPDGAGGWYIGGSFTQVGGVARSRLAQLDANGAVTAFDPSANNTVYALAVAGGTLYAGGAFTTIGGQARNYLAALSAADGTVLSTFDPNASNTVSALAVANGVVYAGGAFTTIGGQTRNRLAALNAADGTALSSFSPSANSAVYALAVANGTVYAGGGFSTIGGQTRSRIAALSAADGTVLSSFNPSASSAVYALAVAGNTVYAGGGFSTIGGQPRSGLVALNASTGAPLPVVLTAFTATLAAPGAVRLAWATASELTSAAFEVERSLDGVAFTKIGTVAAAGTSATPRTYTLLDAVLPAGPRQVYYRLRQVDQDGLAVYSPVRTITLAGAGAGLSVYPNPAVGGAATLLGASPGAAVQVLNALGRLVATATADAAGTTQLAGLAPGLYVVRAGQQALRLAVE